MKRIVVRPLLLLPVLSCNVPGQLAPGFSPYDVPVNFCSGENEPVAVSVRNVGNNPVELQSAALAAVAGHEGDLANFDEPTLDVTKLLANEVGFILVGYRSPEGAEQFVNLVVTSDAENAELVIPIHAFGFVPDNREAVCNGTAEGEGEGEGEAGEGEGEAGEGEGEGEGDAG